MRTASEQLRDALGIASAVEALCGVSGREVEVFIVRPDGMQFDGTPVPPSRPGTVEAHVAPHGAGYRPQDATPWPGVPEVPPEDDEAPLAAPCSPAGPWPRPAVAVAPEPAPFDPWDDASPVNGRGRW